MARKASYFTVFRDGFVIAICHSAKQARRYTTSRAYKRFPDLDSAEEFASWWNYEAQTTRPWLGLPPAIVNTTAQSA